LFDLIAIDSPSQMPGHATQMIVNQPEDPTIHRVFAYMAIITCLITTEILRGQENLPKQMSREGLAELDEKYRMCSSQSIMNNYTTTLRNSVLFRQGFRLSPITIDQFFNMFNAGNPESETYLMFLNPERFRYHYMVEFIHTNRTHFFQVVNNEERQIYEQEARGTETLGRGTGRDTMQRGTERQSEQV
jgi:hypothetical protein